MEVLNNVIQLMDKHAVKHFKLFAGRASDNESRKDMFLFDMIRKGGVAYNEEKALKKLYSNSTDKNAFHRLKNRLFEDIGRSIFLQEHRTNEMMQCLYLVALGYFYAGINSYKVALHFFKRAEPKAKKLEHHGLLDIIYSQLIKLAREIVDINPETYIQKRKENRDILNKLSEVEDILEMLEYRMKITQNLSASAHIPDLLKKTLDEYANNEELKESPKVQFGIYFIISRNLLQKKDYIGLGEYLHSALASFSEKKLFNKSNHQHKLQLLAWIANAAFMNKKYQLSLEYAEKLKQEMERFEKLHYAPFELFYYNVLIINFSVINPDKAIALLKGLASKEEIEKQSYYGVFIYLNLTLLYFQKKQFAEAVKTLNKLYRHQGYENMESRMKLRANIGELLIRFDLKENDFIDYRLKQILKENKTLLNEEAFAEERDFLQLFGKLCENPDLGKKASYKSEAKEFIEKYKENTNTEENLFRYKEWLVEKMKINV